MYSLSFVAVYYTPLFFAILYLSIMGFGDFIKSFQDKCDEVANNVKNHESVKQLDQSMEEGAAKIDDGWKKGLDESTQAANKANEKNGS